MTLSRAKLSWLPLLAAVCVAGTGCGSVSKLVGGKKGQAARQPPLTRSTQLVTSFTVRADPSTGELSFQPAAAASAASTGGVHQQATSYGRAYDLDFSGRAIYNNTTHVLAGDVTLMSGSATTFENVKVIVTNISASDVSVKNASGVTDLSGSSKSYWSFGNLPAYGEVVRNWQFNVPSGVSFTFTLGLYADVWSTPPTDGGTINGLAFLGTSPARGWAVGQGGKVLTTANGGTTWTAQTSNVATDLRDVCFVNSETGWAVGTNGTIIATTNGGKTWRPQNSGVSNTSINGVAFANASVGYAVGGNGLILRTGDAGNTWNQLPPGDVDFNDVDAVGNKVWVVGNGGFVLVSDNYGDSFSEQGLPAPTAGDPPLYYIASVDFVDGNNGWVGGTGGMLFHTSDGGSSWQRQKLDPANASYRPSIVGLKFVGSSNGWAVANSGGGAAFHTLNGGNTWTRVTLPEFVNTLQTVAATSAQLVWVGGDGGVVFLSTTGGFSSGGSWSFSTTGVKYDLKRVQFPSRTTGFAVGGSGTVLKTTNGGQTWAGLPDVPFFEVNGVYFVSNTTGWIVGSGGGCFKTTNGGQTWTDQEAYSPSGFQTLNAIYMIDQNYGWIVGQSGTILVTHDGGSNWDRVEPFQGPSGDNLFDVRFLPGGQTGFIVGSGGRMLFTNDGANWEYGYANTDKDLYGIATAAGKVWLVGKSGTIRKLADDGSWWGQDPGTGQAGAVITLRGVDFLDANRGFIVGGGGTLLRTTDGGDNWTPVPSATTKDLYSVDFFDEDMGALVGRSGTIKTFR
jgi:photosystem II stability/assembly factor-like uncharacterized protein